MWVSLLYWMLLALPAHDGMYPTLRNPLGSTAASAAGWLARAKTPPTAAVARAMAPAAKAERRARWRPGRAAPDSGVGEEDKRVLLRMVGRRRTGRVGCPDNQTTSAAPPAR